MLIICFGLNSTPARFEAREEIHARSAIISAANVHHRPGSRMFYSQLISRFWEGDPEVFKDVLDVVSTKNVKPDKQLHLLAVIRHRTKYDFTQRFILREMLQKAVIIPSDHPSTSLNPLKTFQSWWKRIRSRDGLLSSDDDESV